MSGVLTIQSIMVAVGGPVFVLNCPRTHSCILSSVPAASTSFDDTEPAPVPFLKSCIESCSMFDLAHQTWYWTPDICFVCLKDRKNRNDWTGKYAFGHINYFSLFSFVTLVHDLWYQSTMHQLRLKLFSKHVCHWFPCVNTSRIT